MLHYPKKQPKKAAIISVCLYAGAAVLFTASGFFQPRLAWQLMALVLVSVGIFFTSRYILTDYKYVIKDIERPDGEVKLSIIKINGSREAIMADFKLLDAYAFEKCRSLRDFEKKHGKATKFYGYCSNFSSPDTHMLAINFNNMKVVFAIEANEEFAREIEARLVINKENQNENGKELM